MSISSPHKHIIDFYTFFENNLAVTINESICQVYYKKKAAYQSLKIENVEMRAPEMTESECYLRRLPYIRDVFATLIIDEEEYGTVFMGSIPALTSRGTFLFGKEPVRERVAIIQLRLLPEVRLARRLKKIDGDSKKKDRILREYNEKYKTEYTYQDLHSLDISADLGNYKLYTIEDALTKSVKWSIKRICNFFDAADKETELFVACLPGMFTASVEKFLTNSDILQFLDKTNPLAEISHKRKVTFCGKGGIRNFYSDKIPEREVHPSHEGKLCPVETVESKHIGLNLSLASGADIASDGSGIEKREPYASSSMLGVAASLIPFIEHDDMNRAMMGAKHMKQALPLLFPETPLVRTGMELATGRGSGLCIIAEKDGAFLSSDESSIEIRYSDEPKPRNILLPVMPGIQPGTGSFFRGAHQCVSSTDHNGILMKSNQKFHAGEVLVDCSMTINGELALGVNLLVAYMPWYGYNFEDAIVVSSRLVEEEILTSLHLDDDGCLVRRRLAVGDKITGRHGNKGVVSLILDKDEMPRLEDGTPADILLNPHGILSRMNIGQLYETHLGFFAKKTGEPQIVKPFERSLTWSVIKKRLARFGMEDGKAIVSWTNADGKACHVKAAVGYQYFLKLVHIAEQKSHVRGRGKRVLFTMQPTKGKKSGGGQRIGEMEVWALQAHQAKENLKELLKDKSELGSYQLREGCEFSVVVHTPRTRTGREEIAETGARLAMNQAEDH
ncbi:MAG: hypothetical protein AB2L14_23350 [Candidatus Xenobiia bacterium LiM19]